MLAPPTYDVVEADSVLSREAKSETVLAVFSSMSMSNDITAVSIVCFGLVLVGPIVPFLELDIALLSLLLLLLSATATVAPCCVPPSTAFSLLLPLLPLSSASVPSRSCN